MAERADEASEGRNMWPKLCCKEPEFAVEQATTNMAIETQSSNPCEGVNQEASTESEIYLPPE